NVPIKNPNTTVNIAGYSIDYTDCIAPAFFPQDFYLNIYKIDFSKSGYNFPAAGTKPKYYYATLKYYDAANNLLDIYQPNQVIFNNQLPMPMNLPTSSQMAYNGFDYELTDPGLHAFGFYAKSEGFSASYFSQGEGYYGITKKAAVNADMNIGVKYFNFKHLVSSSEPLSDEFVLFSYKIKSEENFKMADAAVPRIRIPGAPALKSEDPDYGVISLLDKEYNLASTDQNYFKEDINIPVTDMRFFIGPIPCRITVNITGEVSVTVDYQSSTQCDIKAFVNPHASVSLTASGAVDAFNIAYAKIVANVNLLTVDMPYNLQVNNTTKATSIAPKLTVGGLAGQIYFQAGLCIPIPFIDDICTDFRIDILNWKGLEKSLVIDPQKGIVL
ncbi:MAG: hypothetical protein ABI091_15530, partial [Ferruginibacter sp.]